MLEPVRFWNTRKGNGIDAVLIFGIAALLVLPLFGAGYLTRWFSIESTFIADARFLAENWPHPRWQPLWYCGTRFDYIYPPALRYGTAALIKAFGMLPVQAYHLFIAVMYCTGIAGVYVFVRTLAGGRLFGWLAALGTALISPCYLLIPVVRADGFKIAPWRLHVLITYGEGPHITALSLIPFALAAAFVAFRDRKPRYLALATVFCALVVSTNFYGAVALAMFFPLLCWSCWIAFKDGFVWVYAAGIALLAYGLTAFWLVPSYFRITLYNLRFVAEPGTPHSALIWFGLAVVFCVVTFRFFRGRRDLPLALFTFGSVWIFAVDVLGFHYAGLKLAGNPARLVPELDLILLLAAGMVAGWLWRLPLRRWQTIGLRAAIALALMASFYSSARYVKRAWHLYEPDNDVASRLEYDLQRWVAAHLPNSRAGVAGTVRFWYDVWHDLAQVGGGSDQGVTNPMALAAQYYFVSPGKTKPAVSWLQCMGVDIIVVNDLNSKQYYHDFSQPEKYAGLPVLFDDGEGNTIYQVRRAPGIAKILRKADLASLGSVSGEPPLDFIERYAEILENAPATEAKWDGPERLHIAGRFEPGQVLLLQQTYDENWKAYSDDGIPFRVRKDPVGQMLIDVPPGERRIDLRFELPLENLVGRVITVCSLAVLVMLFVRGQGGAARKAAPTNSRI